MKRMQMGNNLEMNVVAESLVRKWLGKCGRCTCKPSLHRSSALVEAAAELTQHPPPPSFVLCLLIHSLAHCIPSADWGIPKGTHWGRISARLLSVCINSFFKIPLLSGCFCLHTNALCSGLKQWICGPQLDHGPGKSRAQSRKLGRWQALLTDVCLDLEEWAAPPARLCLMGCELS